MGKRWGDMSGMVFHKWTVIKRLEKTPFSNDYYWLCKCSCDRQIEKPVAGSHLRSGNSKSCGCLQKEKRGCAKDLLTKEYLLENYVRLGKSSEEIVKELGLKQPYYVYKYLKYYGIEDRHGPEKYQEIWLSYYKQIKKGAILRNIAFSITIEDIWNVFIEQNRKCALTGVELVLDFGTWKDKTNNITGSLDRIESDKGYIKGNIQWIHKDLQFVKSNMKDEELYKIAKMIYFHCKDRYE